MLDLLIPMLLAAVAVAALARRQDLYAALLEGGLDGLRLLVSIVPALVMLLTAVHLLRAAGAVDLLTRWLTPAARVLGLPPQVLPLVLLRPVSGSAALAVGADLWRSMARIRSSAGRPPLCLAVRRRRFTPFPFISARPGSAARATPCPRRSSPT